MEINKQLLYLSIIIICILYFLYKRAFLKEMPTCDGYIVNVYLYILLALLISAFILVFIDKRKYAITNNISLIFFIIATSVLFVFESINPDNILANHMVWLIFIISIATSLYSIRKYSQYKGIFTNVFIIIFILMSVITFIYYYKPTFIELNSISIMILALIIYSLIRIFHVGDTLYMKSIAFLFIFVNILLVLYDSKRLRLNALQCIVPNYPKDSLGLFLDFIKLFNNV